MLYDGREKKLNIFASLPLEELLLLSIFFSLFLLLSYSPSLLHDYDADAQQLQYNVNFRCHNKRIIKYFRSLEGLLK